MKLRCFFFIRSSDLLFFRFVDMNGRSLYIDTGYSGIRCPKSGAWADAEVAWNVTLGQLQMKRREGMVNLLNFAFFFDSQFAPHYSIENL